MPRRIIGLVGNPNVGKTTLFNALTQSNQRVGNWPGVTVERVTGTFQQGQATVEVVDLPGVYSLIHDMSAGSIDEQIASEFIFSQQANAIVNIIDASHLERSLYLTMQLLMLPVPIVLVLTMMDVAKKQNLILLPSVLQQRFSCPVICLEARIRKGLKELKSILAQPLTRTAGVHPIIYPPELEQLLEATRHRLVLQQAPTWLAPWLLENEKQAQKSVTPELIDWLTLQQQTVQRQLGEDIDILLADARYKAIQQVLAVCTLPTDRKGSEFTQRVDRIVLNRVLGIPIFLLVMYCFFSFAINVGGYLQGYVNAVCDQIFVRDFGWLLHKLVLPSSWVSLLVDGVGNGISTTLTFIPVLGCMFLFLAVLEDSGYMARAAFVMDRAMFAIGLPGKSFVPMIIGFGCNVPAVMAARTLNNSRDRILTVMMSPFMSCGARLSIYAVFTAAFFPVGGQNIVFALYFIGILAAVFTGYVLRSSFLSGEPSPLMMELPSYHLPHWQTVGRQTWQRVKGFVWRAGRYIVPVCLGVGMLNAINIDGKPAGDAVSLLAHIGQFFTPLLSPMGIQQDNWPATVGLLTGVLAKEVVVGTLNSLYSQLSHSVHTLHPMYGEIYARFKSQAGAMAYLLFVLLYFPCISTVAVMLREVNRYWTLFAVFWSIGVAYCVAVVFYQLATFAAHPATSLLWVAGAVGFFVLAIFSMRLLAKKPITKNVSVQSPDAAF